MESFTVVYTSSCFRVKGLCIILVNSVLICLQFVLSFTAALFNSVEEPIEGHNWDTLEQSQYIQKERHHGV